MYQRNVVLQQQKQVGQHGVSTRVGANSSLGAVEWALNRWVREAQSTKESSEGLEFHKHLELARRIKMVK